MSATAQLQLARMAYIRQQPDREAALHHRRKNAMISLLSEFEREIEPHVTGGHDQQIAEFKRSCREKLNALCFEAIELSRLKVGEDLNEHAVDLAGKLAFDGNE